jgi:O-antigen ligase
MSDSSSRTDNILAFLLTLAISIPAFLGQDQSMKPIFYALVLLPTLVMVFARKISLVTLCKEYPWVFLLALPMLYWSSSTLWSENPENFSSFLRRSFTTYVFIIGVTHIVSRLQQEIIRYLDLALFLVAIAAAIKLGSVLFTDISASDWRLEGDSAFNRPLHAAHYFGFFATYGLVRCYQEAKTRKWLIYAASLIPSLLYILLTFSRGPLISYILVYLVISIFWFKKPTHAILAIIFAGGVTLVYFDTLTQRGSSFRLEIWHSSIELIQSNFWFGIGEGTKLDIPYGPNRLAPHAHNLFLDVFTRSGFFGLLLINVIALFVAYRTWRAVPSEHLFVGTLLFFFLAMMTDVQKLINSPSGGYVVFWLPLTILLVMNSRTSRLTQTLPNSAHIQFQAL